MHHRDRSKPIGQQGELYDVHAGRVCNVGARWSTSRGRGLHGGDGGVISKVVHMCFAVIWRKFSLLNFECGFKHRR